MTADQSWTARLQHARRLAAVCAVGAGGGGLFALLGLPAAWLAGAMFSCGIAALAGLTAIIPNRIRDVVYVVLGVTMGAGVTPQVIDQMPTWPVTLAGLLMTTALVTAASYLYLRRIAGWDPASAFFGSVPGALTMTIAMAERSPADLRLVALAQTVRLFMLVAVLPFVVAAVHPEPGLAMAGPEGLAGTAILLAAGTAGSLLFLALRVPSGLLLGAFAASSLLHGMGIIGGQVSPAIQIPAFVILGASLGLRFAGTTFRQLRVMLVAVVGVFAVALATACAGAVVLSVATGISLGQMLVAFAPGGLEAMVIVAFALSVDPAFVAAHHLLRFLAVTVLVPVIGPLVWGRGQSPTTKVSDAD
jgi:membrane AbrB-like protein